MFQISEEGKLMKNDRGLNELDIYIAVSADEYAQLFEPDRSATIMKSAAYIASRIERHLTGELPFPEDKIEQVKRIYALATGGRS